MVAAVPDALTPAVNLSEVVGLYQRGGATRQATTAAFAALALPVAARDAEPAAEAGFLEVPAAAMACRSAIGMTVELIR
jgi:hypothetical protein